MVPAPLTTQGVARAAPWRPATPQPWARRARGSILLILTTRPHMPAYGSSSSSTTAKYQSPHLLCTRAQLILTPQLLLGAQGRTRCTFATSENQTATERLVLFHCAFLNAKDNARLYFHHPPCALFSTHRADALSPAPLPAGGMHPEVAALLSPLRRGSTSSSLRD